MRKYWGDGPTQFFYELTPDRVLDSVEELGYSTTGRCLFLNSMENRVVEVEIEDDLGERKSFVLKYYRPGRWNRAEILDEHQFMLDLKNDEVGAIYPIEHDGETLFELAPEGIFFAIFPKMGGRHLEVDVPDSLERFGSAIARLHQSGLSKKAKHRQTLSVENFALQVKDFILEGRYLPENLKSPYEQIVTQIAELARERLKDLPTQRVHGDCHSGNILFRDHIVFVDFDDMLNGPKVQDLWMVLTGDRDEQLRARDRVAEGYEIFLPFPYEQERAIEALRTLRMIHYNGWIAKRFDDPSFQQNFPYFLDESFWQTHIYDLYHQAELI